MTERLVPTDSEDLYSRAAILDPYPHYARLRARGPVVWLRRHRVYALPQFAECKAVLLDDATFISGAGVALNALTNRLSHGTTLNSDGRQHDERRKLVAHRLTPRALRVMQEQVDAQAARVVDAALERGRVDGVGDLALALPMSIVPDLIGWPQEGRDQLLEWGAATFDVLGPRNGQAMRSVVPSLQMLRYARRVAKERSLLPESLGADLLRAVDEGRLDAAGCPKLLVDYLAPSIDTTLSAIASALYLFAQHPDQWQRLRADRSLLPNAINEVVRLESPLRAFSRKVAADVTLAGVALPAGSRVLVLYASANRDELVWESPDEFDITRDASQQLGFGHGTHGCAGQGLARLETRAVLGHLLDRVERLELTGEPVWAVNNIIHRLEHLPLELIPSR
ncbi:cytochrome P450 [Nocardioides pelophilus]|uniref:cytochrome P450 n=1 Tax=Nocardioides pelophilus TaxID=2172019 RepID=UPI0016036037|nr:cytochrome P450 [Nocardioides pelophilus]